ncbi:cysteine proteinase inhibitor A-like isoform X2 [Salvia miltiorrhiza]|uniref:cysteine proteinase inhibitor A-like isoform X2 n=1 Tax=Salvia miltiorrhiza TaxID=226208 RepID=UPI0025AB609E|nr:cysteine proteinase inhibitor A-like isoform X2 [Salvia miltiorrhiza]
MKSKSIDLRKTIHFSLLLAVVAVVCQIGFCSESPEQTITMKLGGLRNTAQNSLEIEDIGRFAVQEHNKNQNTLLEFGRVVNAKEQVVAGKMYHLTVEAVDGGQNKIYEAKVWVKPWMNFKQLQEFKEVRDNPTTSSALGIERGH